MEVIINCDTAVTMAAAMLRQGCETVSLEEAAGEQIITISFGADQTIHWRLQKGRLTAFQMVLRGSYAPVRAARQALLHVVGIELPRSEQLACYTVVQNNGDSLVYRPIAVSRYSSGCASADHNLLYTILSHLLEEERTAKAAAQRTQQINALVKASVQVAQAA